MSNYLLVWKWVFVLGLSFYGWYLEAKIILVINTTIFKLPFEIQLAVIALSPKTDSENVMASAVKGPFFLCWWLKGNLEPLSIALKEVLSRIILEVSLLDLWHLVCSWGVHLSNFLNLFLLTFSHIPIHILTFSAFVCISINQLTQELSVSLDLSFDAFWKAVLYC